MATELYTLQCFIIDRGDNFTRSNRKEIEREFCYEPVDSVGIENPIPTRRVLAANCCYVNARKYSQAKFAQERGKI